MSDWPRKIVTFETSDGKLFRNQASAEWHQDRVRGAELATKLLGSGTSLGASLRAGGFLSVEAHPELDEISASTKLVISHWQCRDEPGYQPIRVTPEGDVFVHGNAGSWSGSYGADCSPREVLRYWQDTKARQTKP